jgi:hypothetical protein
MVILAILHEHCEMTILTLHNRLGRYDEGEVNFRDDLQYGCHPQSWSNAAYSIYSAPKQAKKPNDKQHAGRTIDTGGPLLGMLSLLMLRAILGSLLP